MRSFIKTLALLWAVTAMGQQTDIKNAFLEKWEHSRDYLLQVADAMPEEQYDYKPTERQMSFGEQLQHIRNNIEWLTDTYLTDSPTDVEIKDNPKESVMANLKLAFDRTAGTVAEMTDQQLAETVDFFAGPKSKLQILNLLQDHVTHHRGQLIVYLNLKEVEPPRYVGW